GAITLLVWLLWFCCQDAAVGRKFCGVGIIGTVLRQSSLHAPWPWIESDPTGSVVRGRRPGRRYLFEAYFQGERTRSAGRRVTEYADYQYETKRRLAKFPAFTAMEQHLYRGAIQRR